MEGITHDRLVSQARRLFALAGVDPKPREFLARWLVQDMTAHNCAVCILALYNLTGQLWCHPDTPNPTMQQKFNCPEVWEHGLVIALNHDPYRDTVKVGDLHSVEGKFRKVLIERGDGPSEKFVSDFSGQIVPQFDADDRRKMAERESKPKNGVINKRPGGDSRLFTLYGKMPRRNKQYTWADRRND